MVRSIVILGAQWGDEGKGKIVDLLTSKVRYVVRYQGGNNAGHTIIVNNTKIVSHLIPSGIFHSNIINVIAGGVVLSPKSLVYEIEELKKINILTDKRLFISATCPILLDYHVAMDVAREKKSCCSEVIGTTGCGIGPVYEDKAARRGLRVYDLYEKNFFVDKLKNILNYYNFQLVNYYREEPVNYQLVLQEVMDVADILVDMIIDVPELLNSAYKKGDGIIFEGAQGSLLDIDHGTYPYVTATHTVSGGASVGSGIGPCCIDYIIGVMKAYSTRVGLGPFPTELFDQLGAHLCVRGNEFGATTGRRRRIGWFDAVAVRYSIKINSFFSCCLTKLDVLDGLDEVKICVAYRMLNGDLTYNFLHVVQQKLQCNVIPVYETLPGWLESTKNIKFFDQLPKEAQNYIKRIEEIIEVPIDIVSTGPERSNTIILRNPFDLC